MVQLSFFPESSGENHVSQAQALSALVKCMRLRYADDAVYWFMHFARFFPDQKFRLLRRLLIMTAEDNCNVPVQVHASNWFGTALGAKDEKSWVQSSAAMIHLVCATDNWWKDPVYSHYCLVFRRVDRAFKDASVTQKKEWAEKHLDFDGGRHEMLQVFQAKCSADLWAPHKDKAEFSVWLADEARKRGDISARMTATVHARWAKCLTMDDNYLAQAVYKLLYGPMGVAPFPKVKPEAVYESVEKGRVRLVNPEKPPPWTQDGIHSSGSDKRFAGFVSNMVACSRMYREFGRLHQDDDQKPEFFSTTKLFELLCVADPQLKERGVP